MSGAYKVDDGKALELSALMSKKFFFDHLKITELFSVSFIISFSLLWELSLFLINKYGNVMFSLKIKNLKLIYKFHFVFPVEVIQLL